MTPPLQPMFLQARTHLEHFCSPTDLHEEAVLLSVITFHPLVSAYENEKDLESKNMHEDAFGVIQGEIFQHTF